MLKLLGKVFFRLVGWKITGQLPDLDKYVVIVAPHTSNWDFPIGIAAKFALGLKTKFIAKKELFRPPLGWIFKLLGGIPVDRASSQNFVDQVVTEIARHDQFSVTIAPEGKRSYSPKWKTGFYYIALKADIPIVRIAFDFEHKNLILEKPYYPTGDAENDIAYLRSCFFGIKGKIPENSVY